MINFTYFPKSQNLDVISQQVISIFTESNHEFDSYKFDSNTNTKSSNKILSIISSELDKVGFSVGLGYNKIQIPVTSITNEYQNCFRVNAYNSNNKYVLQVETGRAVMNNEYLKDFIEACLMANVEYLCIAVRNNYRGSNDFDKVCKFFDILYNSPKFGVSLNGLLIIGY